MRIILNIIWFIFGGLILSVLWALLGIVLCVTIVGIPFGRQCFKASILSLAPFGKDVDLNFNEHPIANIIWIILAGWEMALGYFISGIVCCVTIIGIPCGLQHFKFMKLAFCPFGASIV